MIKEHPQSYIQIVKIAEELKDLYELVRVGCLRGILDEPNLVRWDKCLERLQVRSRVKK